MAKYFADPAKRAVWDKVLAETARAKEQQRDGEWITYLIRDPRYEDKKGKPGLPIYVGQTNDFPERVLSRFTKCEKEALEKGVDCIEARVAELLHLGLVARYQVIDRQLTRLTSLVSETNLARRAWNAGYVLLNRKALQNRGGDDITAKMIPSKWLLEFTLAEALQDHLVMELRCPSCRQRLDIPLTYFASRDEPPKTVREIVKNPVWTEEPCGQCAQVTARKIRPCVP
jgi:hypothetical protein